MDTEMDSSMSEDEARVVVDEEGVLARWADWQSRGKQAPVAAIGAEGERPLMFVADELLVDAQEAGLVADLEAMGAEIVPQPEMLPVPEEMVPHNWEPRDLTGEFPMPIRVRFSRPPEIDGAADTLTEFYRANQAGRGILTVTSEGAARVAALAARLVAEGRQVGLNGLGSTETMPLATATEDPAHVAGGNPFAWPAFSGRSRIVQAWQLIESVRAVGSLKPVVWVAILDGGFWLDGAGRPMVAAGQAGSDFGGGVLQINLLDERANASGTNPNKCGNSGCPWHGNAVASAAVGMVNNGAGAAGSGGTVARPVFFRTRISEDQVYRCLQYCTAWGIDVLNMSFSMKRSEFFFATGTWNNAFNFALANGVVMVAAAGNDGEELPDYNVRPATRSPGVITVGALDGNDNATGYSNYGSSVNIWAPGNNIPVAPDGNNPNGSTQSGTSLAAPLVAGVAAMLRAVDPGLNSDQVKQILYESGWEGNGRVARGLDALRAVLGALKGRLPNDYSEDNNTPETAAWLLPTGPGGSLQPIFGGFATRSGADADYYKFDVGGFALVTVSLEWYQLLAYLTLSIESDDPESRGAADMVLTTSAATGTASLQGYLPAGTYRVRVRGNADTAYRLNVAVRSAKMPQDLFEVNDSFETAARLIFEPRKGVFGPLTLRQEWGPGSFDATLHAGVVFKLSGARSINPDYFEFEVPKSSVFRIPTVTIARTDAPLDVTLYDAARQVIQEWTNVRSVDVTPPEESTCYLMVSGAVVNRYTITVRLKADPRAIPGPWQEELQFLPKWWGDPPPYRLFEREKYYAVNVGEEIGDGLAIVFERPEAALRFELVDLEGNVRSEGAETTRGIELNTAGLEAGPYVLRVARLDDAEDLASAARAVNLQLRPPI